MNLDLAALIISVVSAGAAFWSAYVAWKSEKASVRSAVAAEDAVRLTQEQQFENWVSLVASSIKEKLPTNDVPHAAGLSVAHLIDGLPASLQPRRKEIIRLGFRRVLSAGFYDFWKHLCEIQHWDTRTGTSEN